MPEKWTNFQPASVSNATWAKVESNEQFKVMTLSFITPLQHEAGHDASIIIPATLVFGEKDPAGEWSKDLEEPSHILDKYLQDSDSKRPFLVYLCGGPGDGNGYQRVPAVTNFGIKRGYQVLYVDYRGTGNSNPFADPQGLDPNHIAHYLKYFRQDRIVQDYEAIRLWFNQKLLRSVKFTLLCQSFGGWIALTYLSFLPSSLEAVFLTAAIAPFAKTPREAYSQLYKRVINRNEEFYRRYPGDAAHVREIVAHLVGREKDGHGGYKVSGGRYLTAQMFMTLGRAFGAPAAFTTVESSTGEAVRKQTGPGGFERVHEFVQKAAADLAVQPSLKDDTLAMFADKTCESFRLHQRPIYGLLHEAIYCHSPGVVSNWAAWSLGLEIGGLSAGGGKSTTTTTTTGQDHGHEQSPSSSSSKGPKSPASSPKKRSSKPGQQITTGQTQTHLPLPTATSSQLPCVPGSFAWLSPSFDPSRVPATTPFYFSGEMIYPFMFDSHSAPWFKESAELLAQETDWDALYDAERLRENKCEVPVRAVVYKGDMYVDWEVSVEMGRLIGRAEVYLVGLRGDVRKVVGGEGVLGGDGDDDDNDMKGEWEWAHGAVKEKGKTEKVLGLLFDGVAW